MSCDYRIVGEATLKRSLDVIEALQSLREDVLGEEYVELEHIDDQTIRLRVDYDGVNTVNTPDHVASILDSIGPAVVGSAVFEITTSGETCTEWLGETNAVREAKSSVALAVIEENIKELTPRDIIRAMQLLARRQHF